MTTVPPLELPEIPRAQLLNVKVVLGSAFAVLKRRKDSNQRSNPGTRVRGGRS